MTAENGSIRVIDSHSVHKITSGQVVIDLQTAVKELAENSLDAGATNIEIRFKNYGLKSIEVIDNGSGVAPADYDSLALKHCTSKLASFEDLSTVMTFGFRGEALSSLCALSESVIVTTATASEAPMGTILEMDRNGRVKSRTGKAARQRGTTVTVTGLFNPLPVRRKELERNAKREFGKALNLLNAYALVPCVQENKGVRLTVSNQPDGGRKTIQLRTDGTPSTRASVSALWGPKSLDNLIDLNLCFNVETEKSVGRRNATISGDDGAVQVRVRGLISKFAVSCGRAATDRQFFYINGRPCNPSKVQKAFNEVYRSFNATQSPFIVADFILPTNTCDINVSPDKRTIFLHSENNLVEALKKEIEKTYSPSRSTFDVNTSGALGATSSSSQRQHKPIHEEEHDDLTRRLEEEDRTGSDPDDIATNSSIRSNDLTLPESIEDLACSSSSHESNSGILSRTDLRNPGEDITPSENRLDSDRSMLSRSPSVAGSSTAAQDEPPSKVPEPTSSLVRDGSLAFKEQHAYSSLASRSPSREATYLERQQLRLSGLAVSLSPPTYREDRIPTIARLSGRKSTRSSRSPSREPIQTILDTSGASWNLRPSSAGSERPTKRPRLSAKEGTEARRTLRSQLQNFARTGSQIAHASEDPADADEGEDKDEDEGEEERSNEEMLENIDTMAGRPDALQSGDNGGDYREDRDQRTGQPEVMARSSTPLFLDETDDNEDSAAPMGKMNAQDFVIDLTQDNASPVATSDLSQAIDHFEKGSARSTPVTEIIRNLDSEEATLQFELSRVSKVWRDKLSALHDNQDSSEAPSTSVDADAGISNTQDNAKAADALSRVIDKTDFSNMEVIGQFNRGFIIARKVARGASQDAVQTDDLFIVDQHAADEKYNFEMLQRTTKIESQTLFRPEALELTTADELLAIENLEVLRQNGFDISVDEDAAPGRGQRLKLVARPVSKGTVFDMKDLEELVDFMNDRPAGQMVRCSKARAMFAMRACRKSVMIGMSLTRSQMTTVIRHMGTIEQPWNCPHGRPTMRHLSDLSQSSRRREKSSAIDWAAFAAV
ncbi:DNA mismatch repair protein MutL [Heliocybe sulcata]|uniref:DNA mismatch repair protein PMS1 n=1 Tax=Heliocybe sulcata TaxID=5364 RepID=A0A5C3N1X2_9AGAM|nr:DNA mismatch repair protein MutL [Heliocybe sulcata]